MNSDLCIMPITSALRNATADCSDPYHCRVGAGSTWRFSGSYKWGYKPPNMGYNYSYLTYNSTYNYP